VGMAPEYILVEGQQFSKAKLSLDNHVYKNCAIDDCDIYFSGGHGQCLDAVRSGMKTRAAVLERYISAYPDQWYNLFDYWGTKDR